MTKWYCPECDPVPEHAAIFYNTGGLCPCSDEKNRPVELKEINGRSGSIALLKVNYKICLENDK